MVHEKFWAVCVLGSVMAGCAMQAEGTGENPDVKPEDGSELAGTELGSTQQPHALHYTDGTNQWLEQTYPMGKDNPNCKDWWVYDRYRSYAPNVKTWSNFSTYETSHPWAQGAYVNEMYSKLPDSLGYSSVWKTILIDHNSVVARSSGKCSGRYVFQLDNQSSGVFTASAYWFAATLPDYLIAANATACKSLAGESVPAAMVDLYVCEAPRSSDVTSISTWCSSTSGHWRMVGSSLTTGYWNSSSKRCEVGTGVYYPQPSGKVAVSFNMAVKTGIGHGPAPANIQVYRYN
jgi:hypothetical protein